jgi:AcrR family transcriptional regulator
MIPFVGFMTASVSPIYKRLPPGPHQLARGEVVRHQRIRIHGAMIEAVAEDGFLSTTVRQIVGLAGVSRRSFYEQFANKEDCFLATFDLLAGRGVRRMSGAYAAAGGDLEDRLGAAFREFAAVAATRRKAAGLVVLEAQMAGVAGLLRLHGATAVCERLLARSFSESPGANDVPAPIVRAMAGGLQAAMSACLREPAALASANIAEEMLRWTLVFQTPSAEGVSERIAQRAVRRAREARPADARARAQTADGNERERLLENALRLAVLDDYRQLTAPQIAQQANVSMDVFFELFADKSECFLAALDMLGDELLAIASAPDLASSDWPRAVRRVMDELTRFLADHPLYARTIAQEAFAAGPLAARRNLELSHAIATLLTAGAPGRAPSRLTVQGLAGAIWHTIRCQCRSGRIQLLPALSDYLSYVALAPCIGAEAAAEVVSEEGGA